MTEIFSMGFGEEWWESVYQALPRMQLKKAFIIFQGATDFSVAHGWFADPCRSLLLLGDRKALITQAENNDVPHR